MEKKAASAILQEPVVFRISPPGFLKLFGVKSLKWKISPLYLGTLIHIGKYVKSIGLESAKFEEYPFAEIIDKMPNNGKLIGNIIACAVLNGRLKILLFRKIVAWYFKWNVTASDLKQLTILVFSQTNVQDFTFSIVSLKGLDVVSPKRETSPSGTGEIIAPGDQ